MPHPIHQQKTTESIQKEKECNSLAQCVEAYGFDMTPCSNCAQNDLNCIGSEDSSQCSNCISAKKTCDLAPITLKQWESLAREEHQLQQEEEEAMAKILRLCKQQQRLK